MYLFNIILQDKITFHDHFCAHAFQDFVSVYFPFMLISVLYLFLYRHLAEHPTPVLQI